MNLASSKTLNLVIVNSLGMTISSILSSQLPLTKEEMIEMADKACANGFQAKVWDLDELDPIYSC
jgi:hypothetical protein